MISRACARAFAPRYTAAKVNMGMYALGMAEEFRDARPHPVAFNCLWPRTAIDTAAINVITGPLTRKLCRSVDIMADAGRNELTFRAIGRPRRIIMVVGSEAKKSKG